MFVVQGAIHPIFNLMGYGEIGDIIGGATAPVIGLISALLLYMAFDAQREANQIAKDDSDFTNYLKLIEMLDGQSDTIVFNVKGNSYKGREAFGYFRRKLREGQDRFHEIFAEEYRKIDPILRLILEEIVETENERIQLKMAKVFSGYFSDLSSLITIVGPAKLDESKHQYYIGIRKFLLKRISAINKLQGFSTVSLNHIPPKIDLPPD